MIKRNKDSEKEHNRNTIIETKLSIASLENQNKVNMADENTIYYSAESDQNVLIKNFLQSNFSKHDYKNSNVGKLKTSNSKSKFPSARSNVLNKLNISSDNLKKTKTREEYFLQQFSKNLEKQLTNKNDNASDSSSSMNSFFENNIESQDRIDLSSDTTEREFKDERDEKNKDYKCSFCSVESVRKKQHSPNKFSQSIDEEFDPYAKQNDKVKLMFSLKNFKKGNTFRYAIIRMEMEIRKAKAKKNCQYINRKLEELGTIQDDFKEEDELENVSNSGSDDNSDGKSKVKNIKSGNYFKSKVESEPKARFKEIKTVHDINAESKDVRTSNTLNKERVKSSKLDSENLILANTIKGEGLHLVDISEFDKLFKKEVFLDYEQWIRNDVKK